MRHSKNQTAPLPGKRGSCPCYWLSPHRNPLPKGDAVSLQILGVLVAVIVIDASLRSQVSSVRNIQQKSQFIFRSSPCSSPRLGCVRVFAPLFCCFVSSHSTKPRNHLVRSRPCEPRRPTRRPSLLTRVSSARCAGAKSVPSVVAVHWR